MKTTRLLLLPAVLIAFAPAAWSDHGKGFREGRGEYKEEYWDGHCKVERKFKRNGDYKEERKCKGAPHAYHPAPVYVPAPATVVVPAALPPITEPGVTIHGTVRIK